MRPGLLILLLLLLQATLGSLDHHPPVAGFGQGLNNEHSHTWFKKQEGAESNMGSNYLGKRVQEHQPKRMRLSQMKAKINKKYRQRKLLKSKKESPEDPYCVNMDTYSNEFYLVRFAINNPSLPAATRLSQPFTSDQGELFLKLAKDHLLITFMCRNGLKSDSTINVPQ